MGQEAWEAAHNDTKSAFTALMTARDCRVCAPCDPAHRTSKAPGNAPALEIVNTGDGRPAEAGGARPRRGRAEASEASKPLPRQREGFQRSEAAPRDAFLFFW